MLSPTQTNKLRQTLSVDDDKICQMFSALSDPGRYQIFKLLVANQGLCVTDLARLFKVTASAISQRLKVLEMTGFVRRQRYGQLICYQIKKDDPIVKCMMKILKDFIKK